MTTRDSVLLGWHEQYNRQTPDGIFGRVVIDTPARLAIAHFEKALRFSKAQPKVQVWPVKVVAEREVEDRNHTASRIDVLQNLRVALKAGAFVVPDNLRVKELGLDSMNLGLDQPWGVADHPLVRAWALGLWYAEEFNRPPHGDKPFSVAYA